MVSLDLRVSSPLAPKRLSEPALPITRSLPPWPLSVSSPLPRSMTSAPPAPFTVSLPPRAQITSAPEVPVRVSAAEVLSIVQVFALLGGAVPQSGLLAALLLLAVRLRGVEAARAVSVPTSRAEKLAAVVGGGR